MSAKIVTIFNQKGGYGKITVSIHIVGTLGLWGNETLLVDVGEQGTATRQAAQAPEDKPFPTSVISLAPSGGTMHREVCKFVAGYDYIMVNCPPTVRSPSPSSALLVSDVALIPVVPSPSDLWAAMAAKTLTQQTQVTNETLRIRMLASMVQRRAPSAKQAIEILSNDGDIPLMDPMIGLHSTFRECQAIGVTIRGVPGAREAMSEVDLLIGEVLQLLQEGRV